jgi:hypothetical protein
VRERQESGASAYCNAPVARIALDIDSTLHHYWNLLQRIVRNRYGVIGAPDWDALRAKLDPMLERSG